VGAGVEVVTYTLVVLSIEICPMASLSDGASSDLSDDEGACLVVLSMGRYSLTLCSCMLQ